MYINSIFNQTQRILFMISVSNLSFEYEGKQVLHDVSFNVAQNSVVALVGPNGAGKTTLMRCLAALHVPVSGVIKVDGVNALINPRGVHRRIGYLSDFFGLYDRLTVRQSLTHMAECQYLPANMIPQRVKEIEGITGLSDHANVKCASLSRGYRQRVGVAMSIIHKPKFLLLDEPASGMDPEARILLSQLMLDLRDQGMTIMVSSHILAELEDYCTDMLVIRDGRVREHVIHADHQKQNRMSILIKCVGGVEECNALLSARQSVSDIAKEGENGLTFILEGGEEDAAELLQEVMAQKISVLSFEVRKKSLQKAYMDLAREDQKQASKQSGGQS